MGVKVDAAGLETRPVRDRIHRATQRVGMVARGFRGSIFALLAILAVGWFARFQWPEYVVGAILASTFWLVFDQEATKWLNRD